MFFGILFQNPQQYDIGKKVINTIQVQIHVRYLQVVDLAAWMSTIKRGRNLVHVRINCYQEGR